MKTILISGATSGIGLATAHIFAKHNYKLILTGRRADRLSAIAEALGQEYNAMVHTLCFDVKDNTAVEVAIKSIPAGFSNIDILVNNAGLALGLSSVANGELNHWDTMIDTNIKGLLYLSKAILPLMVTNNAGHIINIGSIAGKEAYANGAVYCGTKHAVDAISKGMRHDLLANNIKVTAIHPGMVETEFSEVRFEGDIQRAKAVYTGFKPLMPEDIAHAVYYAATLPAHVCINEMTIMPTAQASATNVLKI